MNKSKWLLVLSVLLGLLLTLLATSGQALVVTPEEDILTPPIVPGVVLVQLKPGVEFDAGDAGVRASEASLRATFSSLGVRDAQPVFPDVAQERTVTLDGNSATDLSHVYRLYLAPDADVLAAVQALNANPLVAYAEPDYLAHPADTTPNAPLFSQQWALHTIHAPSAWDTDTGNYTVAIAIIDSGVDSSHPDLSDKLWINPGEIPANGLDDDNNGYVDDVNGWDFVDDDNDPSDDHGHGTQVAGIASADTNNGAGIAGVCWGCRIMPVKVMQVSGVANYSDVAAGVLYAAQKGAKVINISLGGYSDSATLRSAIETAANTYGAVIVAGAGNDGVSTPFYPAAYSDVIAVAGTTITDTKSTFSNYGAWVDISAPAVSITTTLMGGDYGAVDGTSYAAPFVSGVAGLIRSQHPDWSAPTVQAQVIYTADPVDAQNLGYEGMLGEGRLNAAAAMTETPHSLITIASTAVSGDVYGHPVPGEDATLQVELADEWLNATGVTGTLTTSDPYVTIEQEEAVFGDIDAGTTSFGTPVYSFTVAGGAGYNHPIPFTHAVVANGGAYSATHCFTITTRQPEESVSGLLTSHTTWTSDKVYVVDGDVSVAPGITLTIQAGTEVRFDGNYSLNVGGTLIADGTAAQPIRFLSNTSADWNRIHFDDTSTDASADGSGSYQGGNILRYVEIQDTANGIACTNATPFLAHVTSDGGGMDCALGGTSLWLTDSSIGGDTSVTANLGGVDWQVYLLDTDIIAGDLRLPDDSQVQDCTVSGGINAGDGSTVQMVTTRGGIDITGYGEVTASTTGDTVSLDSGTVSDSSVIDGIDVGTGVVLSNTVRGGGISLDSGTIQGNDVEGSLGLGIHSSGVVTMTRNRVVRNANGAQIGGGLIQGNLIANNAGTGLEVSGTTVASNTLTGNGGDTLIVASGSPVIQGNNIEFNSGTFDLVNNSANPVTATANWWGTTDSGEIGARVYDYQEDFNLGVVTYVPALTGPVQDAPAYVRAITVTPESPVGIQTVTFDVSFSRPMDTETDPSMRFYSTQKGTWQVYTTTASGMNASVNAIAIDAEGNTWFGTHGGGVHVLYLDDTWQRYDASNSGLTADYVIAITIDEEGNRWFGTYWGVSVLRTDGTWQTYTTTNSGLASDNIQAIAVDAEGNRWFGTYNQGVSLLRADETWHTYNTYNSPLVEDEIRAIAIDGEGNKWIGTQHNGVSVLKSDSTWVSHTLPTYGWIHDILVNTDNIWFGTQGGASVLRADGYWQAYTPINSELAHWWVEDITIDDDNKWFGTENRGLSLLRNDGTWQTYNASNSGLADDLIRVTAIEADGTLWVGGCCSGLSVRWGGPEYDIVDSPLWLSPTLYRATYDISTLVPKDTYVIDVSAALGLDGIPIAPNSTYTFTVDYAGAVGDTTPPPAPTIWVDFCLDSTSSAAAGWSASDPDSAITLYRYALGTSPGGTDVINWTNTTGTSVTRDGLSLVQGQQYYFSVKARNEGGLWSESASGNFVAGVLCKRIYLPLVIRSQ